MENNLHVLPTDKPSRLYQLKNDILRLDYKIDRGEANQNIYITNSEEIEWDSYWLNRDNNVVSNGAMFELADKAPSCKKIILTTDQDLIKDGVQAIDNEFLEWFVKNPSCEQVEVQKWFDYESNPNTSYKIIIPKTTQQIIDEDFAGGLTMGQIIPKEERTYTEEEVKNAFLDGWQLRDGDLPFPKAKKKWFNEFKKE